MKPAPWLLLLLILSLPGGGPGSRAFAGNDLPDEAYFAQVVSQTEAGFKVINRILNHPPKNCPTVDGYIFDNDKTKEAYAKFRKSGLRDEITEDEAAALFTEFRNNADIPFRHPEGNCFARAHVMARILELKGIQSEKIFMEGDLNLKAPCAEKGSVTFWFHVAPTVKVRKKDGTLVKMVLDPAIMTSPAPLDQWRGQLNPEKKMNCQPATSAALKTREMGKHTQKCIYYESPKYRYIPPSPPEEFDANGQLIEKKDWDEGDIQESLYNNYGDAKLVANRPMSCLPK